MVKSKYILRIIHGVITLFFIMCLLEVYFSVFTHTRSVILYLALLALAIEGFIVFILNKGDCPLTFIHRNAEDDKYFFELFMPRRLAKHAIPVFSVLTLIGLVLLFIT